jgi:L-alanine-DL-glutamate epimerase-like enolase superfamily enzyme
VKIKQIRAALLSYVFPEPILLKYYGGERTILKRDAMLIRVEADSGLRGYAPGQGSQSALAAITESIAPFLEGRVLGDPDALRVHFASDVSSDPQILKTYHAVEIALYDLLGQARGVPVSELLGGRVRDRIRLYGSAGMYMSPEGYAEEAAAVAALGFRAYKMRPGLGPERDLETVRLMRQAVGPGVDLMVDAHTWWRMGDRSYSYETVEELAKAMGDHAVAWLEEPLPPDDHEAYRRLRALEYIPIASGEHEPSDAGYLDLISTDCVDYVQMDVVCQGGYPTGRRILPEIERQGLRFAFHSWGNDLEVIAAAHLGICWPERVVEWLEYPCYSQGGRKIMYPFPPAQEILKTPLEIQEGVLVVGTGPGLGVTVNEEIIEKYPWKPGPWSYFSMYSPAQTWAVTGDHSIKHA